ncbi:MAG: anti sigma factor C-terminal domain-containing protein [Clostridia bacterium]|nr:anti sigma factor C-terminal domain-containing protein [Clostridia bacterium]
MKYSELIEKYVKGELDNEQAAEVAREIEKHEAIAEHIAEREEIPELEALLEGEKAETRSDSDESKAFAKKVRKQIRRAFLKAGLITGLAVLAAVLFCLYSLPKIVDRAYYDPTVVVETDEYGYETNRMSRDLTVFSELFLPAGFRENVEAVSLGYGKYSLYIQQNHSLTGVFRDTAGMLDRGRLTLYDPNILKFPVVNIFQPYRAGVHCFADCRMDPEASLDSLIGDMREGERRVVYVTFKQPMTYSETLYWCEVVNCVTPLWGAACSGGEVKTPVLYGAHLVPYGVVRSLGGEEYPYLSATSCIKTEECMQQHIASMLKYAADNEEAMKLLTNGQWDEQFTAACRESAADIAENGVRFYGVMFTADADTIKEIYTGLDYSAIYVAPLEG